jgi:hypothetical protein
MMTNQMTNEARTVKGLARMLYNTTADKVVRQVYGEDHHSEYLKEKARRLESDWRAWVCSLDGLNLERLAALALTEDM